MEDSLDEKLIHYLESFLTPARLKKYHKVLDQRTGFITVAVEDVYQLHNTSAVMRSCEVFGVHAIHVIEAVQRKRIDREIAMGAQKWVRVQRHADALECMEHLRVQGYQIVATTPQEGAVMLPDFELDQPSALFFGTETEGLSDGVLDGADVHLKIPMAGFTQSLNISVSAAIILQQLTSQLRQSDLPWALSPIQKMETRLEWVKNNLKDVDGLIARYIQDRTDY